MSNVTTSVIIAAASAVAKVLVIGGIGYASAKYPKSAPTLPSHAMGAISKMNFNLLILPLIFSTIAKSITPNALASLWVVLVAAVVVICLSYGVATVLGKIPCFKLEHKVDFDALRVAAAFPNIVALPLLIFPTLCEFSVVHDAFYEDSSEVGLDESSPSQSEKYRSCVDQANAIIFVYFFGWNFLYWVIGYPALIAAGEKREHIEKIIPPSTPKESTGHSLDSVDHHLRSEANSTDDNEDQNKDNTMHIGNINSSENQHEPGNKKSPSESIIEAEKTSVLRTIIHAFIKTISSTGFIAMVLGFITACIPPLRDALFQPGGGLRFFGSAMESLGAAGTSVGTLVVAASLLHQVGDEDQVEETHECNLCNNPNDDLEYDGAGDSTSRTLVPLDMSCGNESYLVNSRENNSNNDKSLCSEGIAKQPSSDQRSSMRRRSSVSQFGSMVRRRSSIALAAIHKRKPTIRMHTWFIFSRLLVAPAIICLILLGMECGGLLTSVPPIAKMVIIVNAGLPGAQIIVITLKSKGLSDSASIVARVYLPSYLLSVVTITAWTSVGLLISIPNDDDTSLCII